MSRLALNLNDAGITLFDGERVLYREPGYAFLGGDNLVTGNLAFSQSRIDPRRTQHRYWQELSTTPFSDRRFAHLSPADIAARQLEDIWATVKPGDHDLVIVVPGHMTQENLGLLLGIASELGLPVSALVDAAVASTRREYRDSVPVHVDVSLHGVTLTRLAQPGTAQIDRTEILTDTGLFALYDVWLKSISEAFVQQSRFDPLHKAETEQHLLDRLGGWLDDATRRNQVAMELQSGGSAYQAEIESLALIGEVAPLYQLIASKLRALYRAEDIPAIQVTDRVARLPGLVDMLKARVGGEVFVLEAGAAVRGAFARCRGGMADQAGVNFVKQLPWDQSALQADVASTDKDNTGAPSHLLFGHTGYEIGNLPLVIGSHESADERFLMLSTDMPGVSRRHCSLVRRNGQCVVEDHSRYGTFLNGHKIDGNAVLQSGDLLRIGSPGFEFQLITTDEKIG